MRALRRHAWILTAGLLALSGGCKDKQLDDKPIADPLDDPWVDGIDSGDGSAVAAAPTDPATPADPDPKVALAAEAELAGEAGPAVPSAEVLAAPTAADADADAGLDKSAPPKSAATKSAATKSAAKSASAPTDKAAAEPAPAEAPEPADSEPAAAEPFVPAVEPAPAPKPAPPALTIADFHGDYRFSGGSAQRKDLEESIEEAVLQLSAVIRGIGRKRLTKTNPIDNNLEIVIAGDKVTTIFETGFDATCVIDGPTIHYTSSEGDKYKVRVRKKGVKLIQSIVGKDGVKTTVFVLSTDKKRLTVHHKITADRLPDPMTYRLSYSRK